LLAFQPLPDYDAANDTEYQLTAAAHKDFIISVLAFYQREPEALTFLGDNCSTNKAMKALATMRTNHCNYSIKTNHCNYSIKTNHCNYSIIDWS
jgi:hypothetical protein